MHSKRLFAILIVLCLLFFSILLYGVVSYEPIQTPVKVYFFDVGQGDSIYIRAPDGKDIVIDGGPDSSVLYELGRVMPWYDFQIDAVILTHPHRDHIAGLLDIFDRYEVEKIYHSGVSYDSALYEKWISVAIAEGDTKKFAEYEKIDLGDGAFLEFLFPVPEFDVNEYSKELNNASIVLRLVYGENEFLFMGDAEREVEGFLVGGGVELRADVLKIGHHGSDSSSTEDFLRAVNPSTAVISSGENNSFGHPHARVLDRLNRFGVDILRTDKKGTICLESDGVMIVSCDNLFLDDTFRFFINLFGL